MTGDERRNLLPHAWALLALQTQTPGFHAAEMTNADLVWNRATTDEGRASSFPGDRALASLLSAHGLAMNGGVLHAVELLSDSALRAAMEGYRYFGLVESAELLSRAGEIFNEGRDLERHEFELDREYEQYIPDDTAIVRRFEERLASRPDEFAPL